jgi:hypothetical protein
LSTSSTSSSESIGYTPRSSEDDDENLLSVRSENKNQQQLLEEEAEKMKNQDDDDEGFPATKKLREEQKSSEIDSNASRFDGQRFIASVNFSGLQGSKSGSRRL